MESIKDSVIRQEIAGSIRRLKPQVKDIEICLIVKDNNYNQLFESLQKHGYFIKPGVPDIMPWSAKIGAKYLRMFLNEEIKLDIFIADVSNWGGIFLQRTGSATDDSGDVWHGFVPQLYKRWKKVSNGGRMNNAKPTYPNGQMIDVKEEIDVFNICQVQYLEPWERNDCRLIKPL